MVLKLGHFGKEIRNAWKVLKYGAVEGWRRLIGPIARKMMFYAEYRRKGIPYIQ